MGISEENKQKLLIYIFSLIFLSVSLYGAIGDYSNIYDRLIVIGAGLSMFIFILIGRA